MRRFAWLGIVAVAAILVGETVTPSVAGPLRDLFRRVDADPNKEYALQPDHGPWMIMAATFAGQGAYDQAREVVLELRAKYKLEAFIFRKEFDYNQEGAVGLRVNNNGIPVGQARAVDRVGNPVRLQTARDEIEEWGVMVGNYSGIDDARAQRDLYTIKDAEPDALDIVKIRESGRERTFQVLAGFRLMSKYSAQMELQKMQNRITEVSGDPRIRIRSETRNWGPMGSAFLTRNPLRGNEQSEGHIVDKFVFDMNKGVEYGLMKNPGQFTVKVATFTGGSIVDQRKIDDFLRGETLDVSSRLEQAAIKAHELTLALRRKGVQAFEFHDRKMSMVCVGSFNELGVQTPDGRVQLTQAIHETINVFTPAANGQPQTLIGIPFDVTPTVVHVPKRSFGADYLTNAW